VLPARYNPGGFPALFKNLSDHAKSLAPETLLIPGTDGCLVGGESGLGSYPVYASRAVQFHPHGGQSDFVWLSARTPHGAYVW